jgi:hypothetical protein
VTGAVRWPRWPDVSALPLGRGRNDKRLRAKIRSLRTQQRAYGRLRPRSSRFRRTSRCTDDAASEQAELVSVPPLSNPHETVARDGMPGRSERNARCSLERR